MKRSGGSSVGDAPAKAAKLAPWARVLHKRLDELEKGGGEERRTESLIVFRDSFPKARRHSLVVPLSRIRGLGALAKEHLPLLTEMRAEAESLGKECGHLLIHILGTTTCLSVGEGEERSSSADRLPRRPELGVGSMFPPISLAMSGELRPLHLHVISRDFDAPALKTKKHWNSFNTGFFRPIQDVISELETTGRVDTSSSKWNPQLSADLVCSHCEKPFANMPKLKAHLKNIFELTKKSETK